MEALKSLMRLVGDLAFTVLDGIDQMLSSSVGTLAGDDETDTVFTPREDEPTFTNPATGARMTNGIGGVDALGHIYGSRE